MAMIQDVVTFTIKELNLSRVAPSNPAEWTIINGYLLERTTKEGNKWQE